MYFTRIFILFLFINQIIIITAKEEWHMATEQEDSFHPPPRASPHFIRKNSTHAIYFGGYFERVAINLGNNIFLNDLFLLDVSDPSGKIRWTKVEYNSQTVPSPRILGCVDYSPQLNALFLYGGVTFNANFGNMVFFSDSWKFSVETLTWTLLSENSVPGARSSMGCTFIDGYIYMTHGISGNDTLHPVNNTWKWHLASNVWTELVIPQTSPIPAGRFKLIFERFPENNDLIFFGEGETISPQFQEVLFTDLWTFNRQTLEWKQFTIRDAPEAQRDTYAYALTSDRWFLTHSGDSRTNETLTDTCHPPLFCFIRATPTDDTFFLNLKMNENNNNNNNMVADWETEEDFEFRSPPLRRAVLVVFPPTRRVFLVAGYDWNGKNGIGEIYNPFTWVIKLKDKYFP